MRWPTGPGSARGGLSIIHFPSKEALLEAMVSRLLQRFSEQHAEAALNLPEGPLRQLEAYVMASLIGNGETKRIIAALLAASANAPKLLAPVREYYREWFARLDDFGLRFERAAAISLAVDGFWLLELLPLSPLDQKQRDRLSQEIFRIIEEGN
jgi:AcrR family transcriptional regulator